MGCDIHLLVQQQQTDGTWVNIERTEALRVRRNPLLFAALANVGNRHHVPAIAPPRGFPTDLDLRVPEDDCFHSASWVSLAELQAYDWFGPAWEKPIPSAEGGSPPLHHFTQEFREVTLPALAELGPPEGVRLVFMFDC